jgi:hypothetical protein
VRLLSNSDSRYLPGCNAIFLEVSSAEKVTMKQDVVDPRMRHTIYHQIGFRLIDCEYIAPPLSPSFPKLKELFLTVYPFIPSSFAERSDLYLYTSLPTFPRCHLKKTNIISQAQCSKISLRCYGTVPLHQGKLKDLLIMTRISNARLSR